MKTGISAELLAHYAQETTTLARLWKVTRRDGTVLGFTDHDAAITYDGLTYAVTSSFDASAIGTSAALNVDHLEATGLLALGAVEAADIEAGLWDKAAVVLMEVNHADMTMGHNTLRFGEVGEVQRQGQYFTVELRGLAQYLQNRIGRIVAPACDADLGDARCGVDLEAMRLAGSVASAASQRQFVPDTMSDDPVDGYFTYGIVTWVSGLNAGLSMEVKQHTVDSDGALFELQLDMPYAIEAGDTFTAVPGCNKVGRDGDCKIKFDNYVNFRGFEDLPGAHKVLLVGGQ
jgi:uncharacterized phage protein (TIGR02218 family)